MTEWNISENGPQIEIDEKKYAGSEEKKLDISCLKINLGHFKMINMLLSETKHK